MNMSAIETQYFGQTAQVLTNLSGESIGTDGRSPITANRVLGNSLLCAAEAPEWLYDYQSEGGVVATMKPPGLDDIKNRFLPAYTDEEGTEIYQFSFFGPATDSLGMPLDDGEPEVLDELIVKISPSGDVRFGNNTHGNTLAVEKPRYLHSPAGKRLMEIVGYEFEGDIVWTPSPETFKKYCEIAGVGVVLFKEASKLLADEYNTTWKARGYPVGAARIHLYNHDISDDHITALLLGGPELQNVLSQSIENSEATLTPEQISPLIDAFSADYRIVIAENASTTQYHASEARMILRASGAKLGISPEEVDALIEVGQGNASRIGLALNQID